MIDAGEIVASLETELGRAAGPAAPLSGGITNRNFRVRFGARDCVLRLTGSRTELLGIDRESERRATAGAATLGIGPALVAAGEGYLVTEYLDAAPVDSARLRADPGSVARGLRAFHDCGLRLPTRFWVPDLLADYAAIVIEQGGWLPDRYGAARALADRIGAALPLVDPVPCHDDLLGGNLLARREAPTVAILVDWEYAGMGHRMFDLGNLAVNNDFDAAAEERLLEAYFGESPTPRRRAALALMRILSDAREAAWGVLQGVISELDFDFGAYARAHFRRLERAAAHPQLEEWLDGATA